MMFALSYMLIAILEIGKQVVEEDCSFEYGPILKSRLHIITKYVFECNEHVLVFYLAGSHPVAHSDHHGEATENCKQDSHFNGP